MLVPRESLQLLRAAAADGRLRPVCEAHDVDVLVLFGSALTGEDPHDIDAAVGFGHPGSRPLPDVVHALLGLAGEAVDILDLDRGGPVVRQRALTQGELPDYTLLAKAVPQALDGLAAYIRQVAGWAEEQARS